MSNRILSNKFFSHDTREVARNLLGKLLVRSTNSKRLSGIIVETEAYRGFDDTACHAHKGPTERCKVMFGDPGRAYVYLTYGIYNMLNFVTESKFFPSAVLIRAIEPVEGIKEMLKNRGIKRVEELTSGPGKLTKALDIDRSLNDADITKGADLWAEEPENQTIAWLQDFKIEESPRVGIDYADEQARNWKWRYFVSGNPYVSNGYRSSTSNGSSS